MYEYELPMTWTCDLGLVPASFCNPGLWRPVMNLKIWPREIRLNAAGGFEKHSCKEMLAETEVTEPCEACGDLFLAKKGLAAHYSGLGHQVKEDTMDLARAKAAFDLEQARATVKYNTKTKATQTLREEREVLRQAEKEEKLAQARLEAEEG
jgi:hypothetical protein